MKKEPKRYTITSALPYANGPVHIGHLAGVYIPADIYARYLRNNGKEVLFLGGSDEHGVPITLKARKEGVTPQDIVDRYRPRSSITTRRPSNFSPTAISRANVRTATTRRRMATSARLAVRR